MPTIWAFDPIEIKNTFHQGEDCMKKFVSSLREHAKNIIDFEKKKMSPLTKEKLKSHQDTKVCHICGEKNLKKLSKSVNYKKFRAHCHYTGRYRVAEHSICNLKLHVPNEIPGAFHNVSNYNYHFVVK